MSLNNVLDFFTAQDENSFPESSEDDCPPTQLVPEPEPLPPADLPGLTPLRTDGQIQGKLFALTYPKCDVSPSVALARILAKAELQSCGILRAVVCREDHADGTPHLHVSLAFRKALRYTRNKAIFWDFVAGQHGNYQRTRIEAKWLKYIIKGGMDRVVCYPDDFDPQVFVEAAAKKQSYNKEIVAKKILEGERDIGTLSKVHASFVMMNGNKIKSFISLCDDIDKENLSFSELPPLLPVATALLFNAFEHQIWDWLCRVKSGTFGWDTQHLRILGGTGIGKTRLARALRAFFRVYDIPYDRDWYDDYDAKEDMCIFDEYHSQLKVTSLNQFCDGTKLARRCTSTITHPRKPLLMLTNYSWETAYPNALGGNEGILATVTRRWWTLEVTPPNTLLHLCQFLEELVTE